MFFGVEGVEEEALIYFLFRAIPFFYIYTDEENV